MSKETPFIPLAVSSHYSLMRGTDSPAAVCRAAKQMGYDRLALTDTDNICGLWPFLSACREEGLTPIVGARVTDPKKSTTTRFAGGLDIRPKAGYPKARQCFRRSGCNRVQSTRFEYNQTYDAVCLVKNAGGYANLCRLITRRHRDPAFDLSYALPRLAEGLLVLTADAQQLARWHRAGIHTAAALPRRPSSPFHPLVQTARQLKVPLVATPDSFFLDSDGFTTHRLLRAIAGNTTLSRLDAHATVSPDSRLATPEEYRRRFAPVPEALANTFSLSDELTFTGPNFGLVMPPWEEKRGRDAAACLRQTAYAGARKRYGRELGEAVVQRMEHELSIIAGMGFSAYFLVVRKIVRKSPRTCGRGSAAASLVAYCLGITNVYIQEYLRRLHGGAWTPIHPLLSDVLDETLGIMVYQEDVYRAAVVLAGFSDAEADGLRKVIAKKGRQRQLADYHDRFLAGTASLGVSPDQAHAVWQMMMSFSGYSFCKPHSASYARVSFQAAYLKTHHPAEFMAGVISNQGGFYSTFAYVSEARRMGLTIDPPDANASAIRWTGKGRRLRVGLLSVGGLSRRTMEKIIEKRKAGCFTGIMDFFNRVDPGEDEARAMIHCGALDAMDERRSRTRLLWALTQWQADPRRTRRQASLFAEPLFDTDKTAPPAFPPADATERLRREFAVLGFLCDQHPITMFAKDIRSKNTVKVDRLTDLVGRRVRIAAWLVTGKIVHTRKGDPMEFLTFEDETGIVETTFFPAAYRRFCHMLDQNRPYLLSGKAETNWGAVTLTVDGLDRIFFS